MITKEIITGVIKSQVETLKSLDYGTLRDCQIKINKSFALIITGIRRCGKSTFLHQILKKENISYYINLEDPRLEGFGLSDFNKVELIMKELYGEKGIYFFDEIQNIEKWEKFIRYLIDKKERVVITGSNASLLSRELGTKLTGRYLQTEMFPFSFKEFLTMRNLKPSLSSFEEYFYKGGFPEYIKDNDPEIHHRLLSDIIIKDIVVRYGIKNNQILNKIIIYLISNIGNEFSFNSIKNMLEIKSVQSVIDYISYFENSYLIFTVPRFNYSYKKQQINPKKIYSIDNGFSYNNSASFSKDKGKMLENLVFLGLRKKYKNIYYYHEKKECDFIVKEKEKITQVIQVCYDLNEECNDREINGLKEALAEFKLEEGLILTFNQEDNFIIDGKKIIVKPVWKWMLK